MKKIIKHMIKQEGNIYRYIKNKNIQYLYIYLKGYLYCGEIYGTLSYEDKLFKQEFSKWVYAYYNRNDYNDRWSDVILFRNFNQEAKALDVFLKLYKQWYQEEFGEDAW